MPFPSPGHLPDPGIEPEPPVSPMLSQSLQAESAHAGQTLSWDQLAPSLWVTGGEDTGATQEGQEGQSLLQGRET